MFSTVKEALEDIKAGKIVIVVDDASRENEGDFVMAAECVTPEAINFMSIEGRGLICTPVDSTTAKKLDLQPMVENNNCPYGTAFTVTIDAAEGISTGKS